MVHGSSNDTLIGDSWEASFPLQSPSAGITKSNSFTGSKRIILPISITLGISKRRGRKGRKDVVSDSFMPLILENNAAKRQEFGLSNDSGSLPSEQVVENLASVNPSQVDLSGSSEICVVLDAPSPSLAVHAVQGRLSL